MLEFVCDKVNDGKIQLQSARRKQNDIKQHLSVCICACLCVVCVSPEVKAFRKRLISLQSRFESVLSLSLSPPEQQRRRRRQRCLLASLFCSALMMMIDVHSRHANKGGGSVELCTSSQSQTHARTHTHQHMCMFDYDQVIH